MSGFSTNFYAEVSNAITTGISVGGLLLSVYIGWRAVKFFLGYGDDVEFGSAAEYYAWCDENDIEPDFGEVLDHMTDEEKTELFESSEVVH